MRTELLVTEMEFFIMETINKEPEDRENNFLSGRREESE